MIVKLLGGTESNYWGGYILPGFGTPAQDTWTSSLSVSVSLHSFATRTDQGFSTDEVPVPQLWPCFFIPAVSHAASKLFMPRWRPFSAEESRTKSSANSRRLILQLANVAYPIELSAFVDPIHANNEEERWQNAPLPVRPVHILTFFDFDMALQCFWSRFLYWSQN